MEVTRRSKLMGVEEAVAALVPDQCESLWIGGMHMHNVPMALVRECIRQGKRIGTLYAGPSASMAADLLIGVGLVDRVVVGYVGFEHIGMAPNFRRVAETGLSRLEIVEADSASMTLALQAGAMGAPFVALPSGLERTGLPAISPHFYRIVMDPFTGSEGLAVAGVRPQVALIHCQQADEYGNGIFKGSTFCDRMLALASETVIMQVEGIIANEQVIKYPQQTGVPGFCVDAVTQVNFGCHPTSSHRYYNFDDVHLRVYLKASQTEEGFGEYVRNFIREPNEQEEYMRRVQRQGWEELEGQP